MYKTSTQQSVKHHWRKLKNVVFPPTPRPHAFHVCGSTEYIVSWELSGQEGIAEETGDQLMYTCVVLVIICCVTNHPTLCNLKQHSVACRSAVWAGLSKDSSSLLHVVSAGVAGQGAWKFQGDSDTWQLSWCWVLAESSTKVYASLCAAWTLFWSGNWAPRERVFYRVEVHGVCYDLASNITQCCWDHTVFTQVVIKCHQFQEETQQGSRRTCGARDVFVASLENEICHIDHVLLPGVALLL